MITREELEKNITHAICPKMKEWSEPDGNRPYKCNKCPASHATKYGEATQMCYLTANDVAKMALDVTISSLPELRPSFMVPDMPIGCQFADISVWPTKVVHDENAGKYYKQLLEMRK